MIRLARLSHPQGLFYCIACHEGRGGGDTLGGWEDDGRAWQEADCDRLDNS